MPGGVPFRDTIRRPKKYTPSPASLTQLRSNNSTERDNGRKAALATRTKWAQDCAAKTKTFDDLLNACATDKYLAQWNAETAIIRCFGKKQRTVAAFVTARIPPERKLGQLAQPGNNELARLRVALQPAKPSIKQPKKKPEKPQHFTIARSYWVSTQPPMHGRRSR